MPVLSVAVFLVALRMPAVQAMPLSLVITIILTLLVWQVPFDFVAASVIEGLVIASSVLFIVLGAIALLSVMRVSGGLESIRLEFTRLHPDSRVQLLLVGWLFVCFIEGAAGFGTPAPVVAPLLIALGFRPLAAVALALIADCSAVTFGAVGTPVLIGIAQGLGLNPTIPEDYAYLQEITLTAAGMDIGIGIILPVAMVYLATGAFSNKKEKGAFREVLPLAIASALMYSVPAWLVTRFVGIELGGMLGAVFGMIIFVAFVKTGLLMPKRVWRVGEGYLEEEAALELARETEEHHAENAWPVFRTWGPYIFLTVLLLFTRLVPPVKEWLSSITVGINDILGTGISTDFAPLYSPGFIFLVVVAGTILLHRVPSREIKPTSISIGKSVLGTGLVLAAAVPIVRVFLNSGINDQDLLSMPLELAAAAAAAMGPAWPLAAPFVGALGSFVSGSATFSHLMFAELQADVANQVGVSQTVVLAQQIGGANAGNMICVANVVAVAGVTGLLGQEGTIIRKTAPVALTYTGLFAIVGFGLTQIW